MAYKLINNKTILDMSVNDLLSTINRNLPDKVLTEREIKKREKERNKMNVRRERRVTYDIPPAIRQRLKTISSDHAVPESQVASLALARFIYEYDQGKIDLSLFKEPSSSPRYEWNLILPQTFLNVFRSNKSKK
jgi:hypothetical protein